MQKPRQQIESIETREDLASFVGALRLDLNDHPEEWENPTLESFLEAMQGWIESIDGWYANRGEKPPVVHELADICSNLVCVKDIRIELAR